MPTLVQDVAEDTCRPPDSSELLTAPPDQTSDPNLSHHSDPAHSDAAHSDAAGWSDLNDPLGSRVSVGPELPEAYEDAFSAFLNDVSSIPDRTHDPPKSTGLLAPKTSTKNAPLMMEVNEVAVTWLSGPEEVDRMLSSPKDSHFELFKLPPYATEELIKKHYKKLSVLIHPDKCQHDGAADAFHLLTTAYNELLKPEYRSKYAEVIREARDQVLKVRQAVNKKKKDEGKTDFLPTDDDAIRADVIVTCDKIIKERETRLSYAEETRRRNAERDEQQKVAEEAEQYRKEIAHKKWVEERDTRVDNWRGFRVRS